MKGTVLLVTTHCLAWLMTCGVLLQTQTVTGATTTAQQHMHNMDTTTSTGAPITHHMHGMDTTTGAEATQHMHGMDTTTGAEATQHMHGMDSSTSSQPHHHAHGPTTADPHAHHNHGHGHTTADPHAHHNHGHGPTTADPRAHHNHGNGDPHDNHNHGDEHKDDSHGGHGDHTDHGSAHIMFFHFSEETIILFREWATNEETFVPSCVGIALIAVFYEGLKALRQFLLGKAFQGRKLQKRCCTTSCTCFHLLQTILHVIQTAVSYGLMLVFMTYNAWLCISLLIGAGLGFLVFGWSSRSAHDQFEHCN